MNKLFILVNVDTFFLSHRKDIAIAALNVGFDVTIVAKDTGYSDEIKALGLHFIHLPINKTGTNLYEEGITFFFLYQLLKRERPDIVHLVGLKLVLWGGLAGRILGVKGIVSAISGLGVTFSEEHRKNLIARGLLLVFRFIHNRRNVFCIFHNTDDKEMFIRGRVVQESQCIRTWGSGIDLDEYKYQEEPNGGKIRVLFTGRMVEDKGVLILIKAANLLRDQYKDKVEFLLCGGLETNPHALKQECLEALCDKTYIQWLGHRKDVRNLISQCYIFAFPSYYKEGLPKSCIEATAIGRPVITTESIGCKDTVIDQKTGFLIPAKDSQALAERLAFLIEHAEVRRDMGRCARLFAEERFSIKDVVNLHLDLYNKILLD